MVAGGWYPNVRKLDSLELLVLGKSAWQQSEPLHVKINGPGAAVIDNVAYFFGVKNLLHYAAIFFLFNILQ